MSSFYGKRLHFQSQLKTTRQIFFVKYQLQFNKGQSHFIICDGGNTRLFRNPVRIKLVYEILSNSFSS